MACPVNLLKNKQVDEGGVDPNKSTNHDIAKMKSEPGGHKSDSCYFRFQFACYFNITHPPMASNLKQTNKSFQIILSRTGNHFSWRPVPLVFPV